LTVLQEVDGMGKGSLLTFLYGVGLIGAGNPAIAHTGAGLKGAALREANLQGANLFRAEVTDEQLAATWSLQGATMPDGSKHH
jgi:uncharacterized protein YjbI with pentapeptide repeats